MSNTNGDSIIFIINQLRSVGLIPYLNIAPQNTNTTKVEYPIVVINNFSQPSNYTLANGNWRFESYIVNIGIFDNKSNMAGSIETVSTIQTALELQEQITVNDSTMIGTYLNKNIGPIWLSKEHYWATYIGYEVIMGNHPFGNQPMIYSGKVIRSGTVDIPAFSTTVTIPALSFLPTSIVCSVDKPKIGDYNLTATVVQDTLSGTITVELSGQTDKAGYVLSYIASN